ncbi:flagellar hook-length control protein FliK, partial [Actinosynnema sp.]|uniref:flagellar hook-length control protein FliK n=1 Tax=Actinosynnema sp. TaxID=1872144 RepID=UPI003F8408B7
PRDDPRAQPAPATAAAAVTSQVTAQVTAVQAAAQPTPRGLARTGAAVEERASAEVGLDGVAAAGHASLAAQAPTAPTPQVAAPAPAQAPAAPQPVPQLPPSSQLAAALAPLRGRNGVHELTVHLHPLDLGPIAVTAQVNGDQIQLTLSGATETGRDALRAALPDLRREMERAGFGATSFTGGQDGGGQQRGSWQSPAERGFGPRPAMTASAFGSTTQTTATGATTRATGSLDLRA